MARIAPYAELFKDPKGPGDIRPTAAKIVEDQGLVDSPEWKGRVVLITGCSPGGLGPETAKAIRLTGADIYITNRDINKGKQVAEELLANGKQAGKVEVLEMDLSSLGSIRAAAQEFLRRSGNKLNILINNAARPRMDLRFSSARTIWVCTSYSSSKHFKTAATNYPPGHFYLFHLVKDALLASATPTFCSRVVSVSSAAHRNTTINLDDLNWEKREYLTLKAYGQSKLANVHFTNELDRRFSAQHLRANSLHPGGILTPLARYLPHERSEGLKDVPEVYRLLMTPAQGAATSTWAAVARELEDRGGMYLDECAEAVQVVPEPYHLPGYGPQAFNPPTEKKLWEISSELVGIKE
ncbi:NAD(P)-binding protein [Xylaria scruposa]|nr:NAD(P)-binding protein [Xylaria scruposa]